MAEKVATISSPIGCPSPQFVFRTFKHRPIRISLTQVTIAQRTQVELSSFQRGKGLVGCAWACTSAMMRGSGCVCVSRVRACVWQNLISKTPPEKWENIN